MTQLTPLRDIPVPARFKRGDVMVVFGELFSRGYANGIVEQAEKAGMTIVRSTVGRRDADGRLRPLTDEELAPWPKPYINVPLEAGFDMDPAGDGTTPTDQLKNVKMGDWETAKLDWERVEESRRAGVERFRRNTAEYMRQLDALVPKGANVLFVHTMAGGVPRAKIFMPAMNKVFKGTGERHVPSERLQASDMGRFADWNFDEVTAHTFRHLIELSAPIRERVERDGGKAHYVAYGYHGTEILVRGEYRWQTYTPYFQGRAKMKLEKHAEEAWAGGVRAQVFNCPEILTNSSSIFLGVEVSLYPLLGALRREGGERASRVLEECRALLKDEVTIDGILAYTDEYITSELMRRYMKFDLWPQHNGKEQMEYMLESSARLIGWHKDEKQLITYLLSEEVFKACGEVMFREAWNPRAPVWWLGHDVLARALSQGIAQTTAPATAQTTRRS